MYFPPTLDTLRGAKGENVGPDNIFHNILSGNFSMYRKDEAIYNNHPIFHYLDYKDHFIP